MSIYGSGLVDFDADDHAHPRDDTRCAKWKPCTENEAYETSGTYIIGEHDYYRLDPDTACTCRCGPIAYQGSHVLPADDDPRAGSVDLATIAGFISHLPDRPPLSDDTFPYWPWLRLSIAENDTVDDVTVVLDKWQVTQMRDALTWWLNHTEGGDP